MVCYTRWFLICSFKTALISVCHPAPCALKKFKTSGSRRIVVDFLGFFFGGRPRFGSTDSTFLGNTSETERMCLKSSEVNSRTSPFLSVSGCLLIFFYLPWVGFSEADHPYSSLNWCEADDMQSFLEIDRSDKPLLWIVFANILNDSRRVPVEFGSLFKRKISVFNVPLIFIGIIFNLHCIYCSNEKYNCQCFLLL